MKRRLFSLLGIGLLIGATAVWMTYQLNRAAIDQIRLHEDSLLHEAIAHFDNMVIARSWNASHGGVYIKQHGLLKPNPYLKDPVLHAENNETLIKVNPAWMTRQISQIANQHSAYYYKITSLKPVNPNNRPDAFERQALEYFEAHPEKPYYWRFVRSENDTLQAFDFMGALKTAKACLNCHGDYKEGDIRGGIRISMPTEHINNSVLHHKEESKRISSMVVFVAAVAFGIIGMLLWNLLSHKDRLQVLNNELEVEVAARTQELQKLNENLEERVQSEVLKNQKKERYLLAQSRHAAMGEMVGMLAHQWRQPITVIAMGANNMLIDLELDTVDPESLKEELEQIVSETKQLSQLIDDFRGHFEEHGEGELSPICSMADEVLDMMKSSFEHHDIEIVRSYDEDACGYGCSREMLQVYMNLIHNAKEALQKSSTEPRLLTVTVGREKGWCVTTVINTGSQIDEADFDRLFDPYFSTKTEQQEVGLGLYVSEIIVEKHLKGSIRIYNVDGGVCAEVRFPDSDGCQRLA